MKDQIINTIELSRDYSPLNKAENKLKYSQYLLNNIYAFYCHAGLFIGRFLPFPKYLTVMEKFRRTCKRKKSFIKFLLTLCWAICNLPIVLPTLIFTAITSLITTPFSLAADSLREIHTFLKTHSKRFGLTYITNKNYYGDSNIKYFKFLSKNISIFSLRSAIYVSSFLLPFYVPMMTKHWQKWQYGSKKIRAFSYVTKTPLYIPGAIGTIILSIVAAPFGLGKDSLREIRSSINSYRSDLGLSYTKKNHYNYSDIKYLKWLWKNSSAFAGNAAIYASTFLLPGYVPLMSKHWVSWKHKSRKYRFLSHVSQAPITLPAKISAGIFSLITGSFALMADSLRTSKKLMNNPHSAGYHSINYLPNDYDEQLNLEYESIDEYSQSRIQFTKFLRNNTSVFACRSSLYISAICLPGYLPLFANRWSNWKNKSKKHKSLYYVSRAPIVLPAKISAGITSTAIIAPGLVADATYNTYKPIKTKITLPKRKRKPTKIIKLVQKEKALIKIISSDVHHEESWEFVCNQLNNPSTVRPTKNSGYILTPEARATVYNPKTNKIVTRTISNERGAPKKTKYIKKTSLTLPPQDGMMHYFTGTITYDIGLIFNIDHCDLKDEKYVFDSNAFTNNEWWVGGKGANAKQSMPIAELRNSNREKRKDNEIPSHNEILACPSKKSVCGVFSLFGDTGNRINALHKKYYIKRFLGKDVPILIMNDTDPAYEYRGKLQLEDILEARAREGNTAAKRFLNAITENLNYEFAFIVNDIILATKMTKQEKQKLLLKSIQTKNGEIVANTLLNAGKTNPNRYCDPKTENYALHLAVIHRRSELIAELCKKGANTSQTNKNGRSPLALALYHEQYDLIETMIEHGFNTFTADQIAFVLIKLLHKNRFELALKLLSKTNNKLYTHLLKQKISNDDLIKFSVLKAISSYQHRKRPGKWINDERTQQIEALFAILREQKTPVKKAQEIYQIIQAIETAHQDHSRLARIKLTKSALAGNLRDTLFYLLNQKIITASEFNKIMEGKIAKTEKGTKKGDKAVKLVHQENALIKLIQSPWEIERDWEFVLGQLKDPKRARPIKDAKNGENRKRIYNPRTQEWSDRINKDQRGTPKKTHYTKKTSVTLTPHDGVMQPFGADYGTGLLFNLKYCDLKDGKYVFKADAWTNRRWWIQGNNQLNDAFAQNQHNTPDKKNQCFISCPIDAIREHNRTLRARNEVPSHNEILACLREKALKAVWTPADNTTSRLNALSRKYYVKQKLGKKLPILIMTKKEKVKEYKPEQQILDITNVLCYRNEFPQAAGSIIDNMPNGINFVIHGILSSQKVNLNNHFTKQGRNFVLHLAVIANNTKLVKKLCQHGANAAQENAKQRTPLSIALYNKHYDLVELMIKHASNTLTPYQIGDAVNTLLEQNRYDFAEKIIPLMDGVSRNYFNRQNTTDLNILKFNIADAIATYKARKRPGHWQNQARDAAITNIYDTFQDANISANDGEVTAIKAKIETIKISHNNHRFWAKKGITKSGLVRNLEKVPELKI